MDHSCQAAEWLKSQQYSSIGFLDDNAQLAALGSGLQIRNLVQFYQVGLSVPRNPERFAFWAEQLVNNWTGLDAIIVYLPEEPLNLHPKTVGLKRIFRSFHFPPELLLFLKAKLSEKGYQLVKRFGEIRILARPR